MTSVHWTKTSWESVSDKVEEDEMEDELESLYMEVKMKITWHKAQRTSIAPK